MVWRHISNGARTFWRASFSKKYLFYTNTLTSGLLLGAGDFIQQEVETRQGRHGKDNQYDHSRTARMFAVGLAEGPPHHFFYAWLDGVLPGTSLRVVGLKILTDQILAAPVFAVIFFYGMGILQCQSMAENWAEFKKKFPTVYLFDWCIWPPTQFVNFMYVPQKFRVAYINCITVLWDVFLSYIKHFDHLEEEFPKDKS